MMTGIYDKGTIQAARIVIRKLKIGYLCIPVKIFSIHSFFSQLYHL